MSDIMKTRNRDQSAGPSDAAATTKRKKIEEGHGPEQDGCKDDYARDSSAKRMRIAEEV